MLKTRLITASILIPSLIFAILFSSNFTWSLLTLFVMLIGAIEWTKLAQLKQAKQTIHILANAVLGIWIVYQFSISQQYAFFMQAIVIAASIFWLFLAPLFIFKANRLANNQTLTSIVGILLLSATLMAFIGLHKTDPMLLIGVIATVSIADSAAYFSGKRFGKHKLAPTISPGKTWEGVAGAIIAIAIIGSIVSTYMHFSLLIVLGLMLLVVLSIMGDLFESKLKREAGIKDSGNILPGHGGILDRIDGIMPAVTVSLLYLYLPLYL